MYVPYYMYIMCGTQWSQSHNVMCTGIDITATGILCCLTPLSLKRQYTHYVYLHIHVHVHVIVIAIVGTRLSVYS